MFPHDMCWHTYATYHRPRPETGKIRSSLLMWVLVPVKARSCAIQVFISHAHRYGTHQSCSSSYYRALSW